MSEAIAQAAAYDLIDRFLRNNLYDDDYAKYSEALEALSQPAPSPQPALPVVSDEQIEREYELAMGQHLRPQDRAGVLKVCRAILALRPAVEPMTTEQRDYVSVPISLIRRAQNAINWHLEPNSPDEHEATMLELTAIGWPNGGPGITAKAEGVRDGRST